MTTLRVVLLKEELLTTCYSWTSPLLFWGCYHVPFIKYECVYECTLFYRLSLEFVRIGEKVESHVTSLRVRSVLEFSGKLTITIN